MTIVIPRFKHVFLIPQLSPLFSPILFGFVPIRVHSGSSVVNPTSRSDPPVPLRL